MLKSKIVLSLMILFLLGGCNVWGQKDIAEMDPSELPDVIAFQDDFTREFMSSLEEVEDGYYLFESKTGGYTMMYPENAKMDEIYYEKPRDNYEGIHYAESKKTNDYQYSVRATYNEGGRANDFNTLKGILSARTGYEGDYESIEYDGKTVHFATSEYVDQDEDIISYNFLGIIMLNTRDQSLSIRYNVVPNDDNSIDLEAIQNEVTKIMESIEFK